MNKIYPLKTGLILSKNVVYVLKLFADTSHTFSQLSLLWIYGRADIKLDNSISIRDGNPNPTKFLDPERIRICKLNCGFGLLILALKKTFSQ